MSSSDSSNNQIHSSVSLSSSSPSSSSYVLATEPPVTANSPAKLPSYGIDYAQSSSDSFDSTGPLPTPTMSCVYNSASPTGKTILITTTSGGHSSVTAASHHHHHHPSMSTSSVGQPGSSSSQITIFTHHHHHHTSSSSGSDSSSGGSGGIGGGSGGSGSKGADGTADDGAAKLQQQQHQQQPPPPGAAVGINIMINNHFNEPPPPPPASAAAAPGKLSLKQLHIKEEPQQTRLSADATLKSPPLTSVFDSPHSAVHTPSPTGSSCSPTDSPLQLRPAQQVATTTVTVTNTPAASAAASSPAFAASDEVFVCLSDGRYHLGCIRQLDGRGARALVHFPDGSECWAPLAEMQRVATREAVDSPMCIVCKSTAGAAVDGAMELALKCADCGRAYHPRRCAAASADGVWFCRRGHRNQLQLPVAAGGDGLAMVIKVETDDAEMEVEVEKLDEAEAAETEMEDGAAVEEQRRMAIVGRVKRSMQLPYVLSSLTWDKAHRENAERTYCYCGAAGDWQMQMLQCARCRQWFHEKCADSLSYPLYCGDRFYVFACALCNGGREFVRRQQIRLDDLVHLLLFNLSVHNAQRRYFDVANVIVPYAIDNWHTLQLSPKFRAWSATDIRERIAKCLANNPSRFKQRSSLSLQHHQHQHQHHHHQSVAQFGLCSRQSPPAAPIVSLATVAARHPLSDDLLAQIVRQSATSVSPSSSSTASPHFVPRSQIADGLLAHSAEMRYTMSGRAYMRAKPKASPPPTHPATLVASSPPSSATTTTGSSSSGCSDQFQSDDDDEVLANLGKQRPSGGGVSGSWKRRQPPVSEEANSSKAAAAAADVSSSSGETETPSDVYDYCSAREEAEARAQIALRPSPTTSPSSRSTSAGSLSATARPESAAPSPVAPPAAAAATTPNPPTTSSQQQQQLQQQQHHHQHQHKRKRGRPLAAPSSVLHLAFSAAAATTSTSTATDSSDTDNSSRGALDLIIPPPKDFAGRNNPFLLSQPQQLMAQKPAAATAAALHLPIATKGRPRGKGARATAAAVAGAATLGGVDVRFVRTVKRRLSARDLVIGPNMEVKRRKIRRGSGGGGQVVEVISTAAIAVKPTTVRTDFRDLSLSVAAIAASSAATASPPSATASTITTTTPLQHIVVPPPPPPTLCGVHRPEEAYGIGGRRLRKRMDTNYSETGRRSGGTAGASAASPGSVMATAATAASSGIGGGSGVGGSGSNSCSSSASSSSIGPASTVSSFSLLSALSSGSSSSSSSSASAAAHFLVGAGGSSAQPLPQLPPTEAAASGTAGAGATATAPRLTELQSSLTQYFGAANRIASGEQFAIRGKRIGLDGRPQYLIEWE